MKLFISGSSGFLGSHLYLRALERGHSVTGADIRMFPDGRVVQMRLGSIATLTPADLDGCDCLVHMAAYTSLFGFADNMAANYTTNVSSFINLLECARLAGVRKVVYASSSAVYCDGIGESFREDEPIDHTRLVSHYGKSKLADELIAGSYADAFGMNLLGLRYFNVYGPGDERKGNRCAPVQHFVNSRAKGEPILIYNDGTQAKDFIHVDDAIDITFRLIDADARGIYNVGTGKATTFNRCAGIIGGPVCYAPHPSPFGYQYFTKADTTKLLATIGPYDFIDVETGMARMMQQEVCA